MSGIVQAVGLWYCEAIKIKISCIETISETLTVRLSFIQSCRTEFWRLNVLNVQHSLEKSLKLCCLVTSYLEDSEYFVSTTKWLALWKRWTWKNYSVSLKPPIDNSYWMIQIQVSKYRNTEHLVYVHIQGPSFVLLWRQKFSIELRKFYS